jgi:hypothetical protein
VAFTETNTQDGCDELFELSARSKVKVFVGLELMTDKGQYLCFFPDPLMAPEPVQMWGSNREQPWSAAECLPKVKSLGAAVVAARPYDRDLPYPALDHVLSLKLLSGVEAYNARLNPLANDLALEAAETLMLPTTGGSDVRASLDEVGRGATLFKRPLATQKDLVAALEAGEFWAVMMGELPRLTRPGEARQADRQRAAAKKKARRFSRGR